MRTRKAAQLRAQIMMGQASVRWAVRELSQAGIRFNDERFWISLLGILESWDRSERVSGGWRETAVQRHARWMLALRWTRALDRIRESARGN